MVAPTWLLMSSPMIGTPGVGELLGPDRVRSNEYRDGVHEGHARVERALRVEALGVLGTDREVGHEDLCARVFEYAHDVDRLGRRLFDHGAVVLVQSVHRRSALDGDAERRDVGELDGVVLTTLDGLAEVAADLGGVDVEGRHELEVADVIATEHDVHETRYVVGRIGVLVVGNALDE